MKTPNILLVGFGGYLKSFLPLHSIEVTGNDIVIIVQPQYALFTISFFKSHITSQYKILTSITATDYLDKKNRFEVSYEFLSLTFNNRLRVKTFVNEITCLESSHNIYNSAKWWEREVWDLFGIFFTNHPDLRKILTDYGFEGYPLRKDFPVTGFVEVRFDNVTKRIICEPLELAQEFRTFLFESPWAINTKFATKKIKTFF
jgi:NADH dehydrogenase (ubiquinone) Fe-S protein 3